MRMRWLVLSMLLTRAVSAQATLTQMQKLQLWDAANKEAVKYLDQGKVGLARLCLYSSTNMIFNAAQYKALQEPPIKELWEAYQVARQRAWPNAGDALTQEAVKAMGDAYQRDKGQLGLYMQLMEFATFPNGRDQYRRKISDMIAQRKLAWDFAANFLMSAPPPDQLMTVKQVFDQYFAAHLFAGLFDITFGPAMVMDQAVQRVIPEALKDIDTLFANAKKSSDPSTIWSELDLIQEQVSILSTLEAALREEAPQEDLKAKLAVVAETSKTESARAEKIYEAKIDSNRFPGDEWKGKDRDAVLAAAKKAYSQAFPKEKVLKMALTADGVGERWESWWDNATLITAYVGYIKVATAVDAGDGKARVFSSWFRKNRNADGSWTGVYYHSNIGSYLMRRANLDK